MFWIIGLAISLIPSLWLNSAQAVPTCNPNSSWTDTERWAFAQLCSGTEANFSSADPDRTLDPVQAVGWSANRTLRASFIHDIFLNPAYSLELKNPRVTISGALIVGALDLTSAKLYARLEMSNSRFTDEVNFSSIRTDHSLILKGSYFAKQLDLSDAKIGDQLWLDGIVCSNHLNLEFIDVANHLLMTGTSLTHINASGASAKQIAIVRSTIDGELNGDGLHAKGLLLLDESTFSAVNLRGATIDDSLSASGVQIRGILDLTASSIGYAVFGVGRFGSAQRANINSIKLVGSRLSGDLELSHVDIAERIDATGLSAKGFRVVSANFNSGATLEASDLSFVQLSDTKSKGSFRANASSVSKYVSIQANSHLESASFINASIASGVHIDHSRVRSLEVERSSIGGDIRLATSKFNHVDLSGSTIQGALIVGYGTHATSWEQQGTLILSGTRVQSVQDRTDAWPANLNLVGFTYSQLGIFDPLLRIKGDRTEIGAVDNFVARPVDWYDAWLRKQDFFSPQPYVQLAAILRQAGQPDKANDVSYLGKLREETNSDGMAKFGLMISRITIGYGYRYARALWWVIGFTGIGAIILTASGQARKATNRVSEFGWASVYSLSMLVPALGIKGRWSDEVRLSGYVELYFILHQVAGFVLGGFVLAGLAGWTQGH